MSASPPVLVRALLAGLLAAILAPPPAHAERGVILTERSLYRNIIVYEGDGLRCMSFMRQQVTGARQSCLKLGDPDELVFDYTKMIMGALYVAPQPKTILVIGLGGGTLPMAFAKLLPDADIDAVEVDGAVIRIARQLFGLQPSDRLRLHESDGRVFVKRAVARERRYDLVVLDAFDVDYIPEHMLTREFLGEARAIMAPHGVFVANTFSSSALYDPESATYESAFGEFYNLRGPGNRVVIARLGGLPPREEVVRNADHYEAAFARFHVTKDSILPLMSSKPDWRRDARPLTDQYSPSNLLNGLTRFGG